MDDRIFNLPELLFLGQFLPCPGAVVIVAVYLVLELQPLVIALLYYGQLLQFIHNLVHRFLHRFGQIAVGLLALDRLQLRGQLFHLLPDLRSRADALRHLTGQTSNGPACLPHQLIPRLGFLLIGVKHLLPENLIHQL